MSTRDWMGRVAAAATVAAVIAGGSVPQTAHAAGSGAYQINARHDGEQRDPLLRPPFRKRWTTNLGAALSYPIIAAGRVFVTAGDEDQREPWLYALDGLTGEVVWSRSLA